jgi:hypothetical protein
MLMDEGMHTQCGRLLVLSLLQLVDVKSSTEWRRSLGHKPLRLSMPGHA